MPACKVFIVDDDTDEIYFYKAAMEAIAAEIDFSFFTNAEGVVPFLELVKGDELPHVMILDLNMPKVNGYELLIEIKSSKRYRRIPVIVCSTSTNPKDKHRCIAAGAEDYIVKPIELFEYTVLLNRILNQFNAA